MALVFVTSLEVGFFICGRFHLIYNIAHCIEKGYIREVYFVYPQTSTTHIVYLHNKIYTFSHENKQI